MENGLAIILILIGLFSVFFLVLESRRNRFLHGLDILLRLTSEFDNEKYKRTRKALVVFLIENNWSTLNLSSHEEALVTEVMDHFQIVGLILRKGLMDRELVYSEYFHLLAHYVHFFKDFIDFSRGIDSTIWEDADWMYKSLMTLEKRYRIKGAYLGPTEQTMREFLSEESSL